MDKAFVAIFFIFRGNREKKQQANDKKKNNYHNAILCANRMLPII